MSTILGLHVGSDRVGAVSVGDDGAMVPVPLGEAGPTTATAVGPEADGARLVGDAVERDGEVVRDPLERAVAGEPDALTALVGHVIGRAVATVDDPPDRLALVIPDELDGPQRDRVVAAAGAAGIADVVTVPRAVALSGRPSTDDSRPAELLLAAGAALTVHRMPPPIRTREDVEGPAAVPPIVPVVPVDTGPPVSVFDGDDEDVVAPPVRSAAAEGPGPTPSPAAPPTTAMAAVGGTGPPPRGPEMIPVPDRRVPLWLVLSFALVLVAILAVVALLVLRDGDDPADTVTDDSTTTAPTTSQDPDTSTTSPSTTSSSTSSTTSSPTSSSTTSTSSTTTVPRPVADPGPVTLVETGLQLDTGTVLGFGQNGATVLDELASVLGDPDVEGAWEVTELCAGEQNRFVRWGDLEIVLEADTPDEEEEPDGVFVEWYADGADDPVGLVTRDGLGVGATIGFLEVNYGTSLQIAPAFEGATEGVFAVTNSATGGLIVGVTDGLAPDDAVREMWAGDACQRTFL